MRGPIKVDHPQGCHPWQGRLNGGYGQHRRVWECLVGPIPPGLVLDHLCCNKACVNPEHLEPVTVAENSKRGDRGTWKRGDRTAVPPLALRVKRHKPVQPLTTKERNRERARWATVQREIAMKRWREADWREARRQADIRRQQQRHNLNTTD